MEPIKFKVDADEIQRLFLSVQKGEILKELKTELGYREQVFPNLCKGDFKKQTNLQRRCALLQLAIATLEMVTNDEYQLCRLRFKHRVQCVQSNFLDDLK